MADNLTKQLIETVKNKVPLTGGLSIKGYPVMGTLSDMKNFKIEDGVLKLRYGTKTVASFDNKRFYFLKNFEFCGAEVLFGLDYQLCLHAFFENYEGYDFIVRDASQWHKNEMQLQQNQLVIGKDENDHDIISDPWTLGKLFNNGTQFWAYENQKYIMFFNDHGEIRVIVKDGGFKIHKDERYIEVDIKDATNRVFDVPPALKNDTRNVAPRITGEYRFARVNELGVISELTEPQYLQTWQSKLAARIPIQTFQQQDLEIVTSSKSPDGEHKYIYYDTQDNLVLNADSWQKPPAEELPQFYEPAIVFVACEDMTVAKNKTSNIEVNVGYGGDILAYKTFGFSDQFLTIPKGIYLIPLFQYKEQETDVMLEEFMDDNDLIDSLTTGESVYHIAPITQEISQDALGKMLMLDLISARFPQYNSLKKVKILSKTVVSRIISAVTFSFGIGLNPYYWDSKNVNSGEALAKHIFESCVGSVRLISRVRAAENSAESIRDLIFKQFANDSAYNLSSQAYIEKTYFKDETEVETPYFFDIGTCTAFKLEDNDELYKDASDEHYTISVSNYYPDNKGGHASASPEGEQTVVTGRGKLYVVNNFKPFINYNAVTQVKMIYPDSYCAYQYNKKTDTVFDTVYKTAFMDTLLYDSEATDSVVVGDNFEFISSDGSLKSVFKDDAFMANKSDVKNISDRFAIWNGNKILGISQRLFVDKNNPYVPVYLDDNIDPENLLVRYSPVLSLEFMNQRSFRFELPLIRRAIRNPQFLCVSNNYVYEFEDNRLWYGSAYDFMLTGYTYLDGSLLKLIAYNEGVLACTTSGLYYVNRETVQPVVNGRAIRADFAGETQVGGIVIAENKVYIVRTEITDSGARIETANLISEPINELVFNGTIKLTCNKRQLYLADDYNVYGFDTRAGIWNLRYNYGNKRIADIFILDNRLGILFDNEVDAAKANSEYEEPTISQR